MLLDDIGQYLQSRGIGTLGVDIFLGQLPDSPDNVISLFEYSGEPAPVYYDGEYPGMQVRVRNTRYLAGRSKLQQVMEALNGLANVNLGSTWYLLIYIYQGPEGLGCDAQGRQEIFCNFRVKKILG